MGRVRAGLTATPPKITVGQQLGDWLDDRKGKVRPGTWVTYEGQVRVHLGAVRLVPLAKLTPADVRRLVRDRTTAGCAPATVRQSLVVLRMALKQAVDDGLIPRNVATSVKPPRVERRELEVYQDDEPADLLEAAATDPLGPLWMLMLGTAIRLGEALGLRWQDVDLAAGEISVRRSLRPIDARFRDGKERLQLVEPKTDESSKPVPLPDFAVEALRGYRAAAAAKPANRLGLVFTSPRGTPLDPRNVRRSWYAMLDRAGLRRIRPHDVRHTTISLALAGGASLDDAKDLARHRSIRQTSDTYSHLVRARRREVTGMVERATRRRAV